MAHIHVTHGGSVATITIERPGRFNSLDVTTAQDFRRAGLQCARDPAVRVVVLRGLPGMFCIRIHTNQPGRKFFFMQLYGQRTTDKTHSDYGYFFSLHFIYCSTVLLFQLLLQIFLLSHTN